MIKKLSNQKLLLLILSLIALGFMLGGVVYEGYLGVVLVRSNSLDEILYFVNNVKSLDKVYLVSLVKSMSDTSVSLVKFIQALEINHVIAPTLLLIVYDINRVYFKNTQIKVSIISFMLSLILKYIVVLAIALFISPSVMNPVILFMGIGFMLLVHQIIILVVVIMLFSALFKISREEGSTC